ncbi:MAG TPA: L,D-transpeptidase [Rhodanobacteraceae bacterium]|nr:L,D-transpeptidase [Rhodanobacteraceae bacterium]
MQRFAILFLFFLATTASAVPFWGARESSPADVAPTDLKPGEWIWGGDNKAMGPMAVIVSLTEQRAYVYRNGILIAVSTVSTGKKGHETPTGVFTILQKDKDHHSKKYDNAPMPYQERLTWDGIALHAGGLPGFPESHGCVHLPTKFAELLFGATNMGMTVVIAEQGSSPVAVVHPRPILPIDPRTGAGTNVPPLETGEAFRWTPDVAPDGPISMVLSRSDERIVVYRNGVEIGRARVVFRDPAAKVGTHAYIVADGYMDGDNPMLPGTRMPKWITIGIPGHADEANQPVDVETVSNIAVPRGFAEDVMPLLRPGVVLLATDASVNEETTGGKTQVLNSDPPSA